MGHKTPFREDRFLLKESEIHGTGCFAVKDMEKDSFLFEYRGEVIDEVEGDKRDGEGNSFILDLENGFNMDGDCEECEPAKFLNHSCDPNVKIEYIGEGLGMRVSFHTMRDIERGEELSWDYERVLCVECNCGLCKGERANLNERLEVQR